jgi:hypothetical protein
MEADPGLREERDFGFEAIGETYEQKSNAEVGERRGGGDETHAVARSAGVARREGHDAADGKQKYSAELKAGVKRGNGAGGLTHEDCEAEGEPESEATADIAHEDSGVSNGDGEQKEKRDVHTDFNAEESAEGD